MLRRYTLIILALLVAGLGLASLPAAGSTVTSRATIVVDRSQVTGTIRSLQQIFKTWRNDCS